RARAPQGDLRGAARGRRSAPSPARRRSSAARRHRAPLDSAGARPDRGSRAPARVRPALMAGRVLVTAAGVVLVVAAGYGLLLLSPLLARKPLPTRLAYAWLLGVGGLGSALFLESHLLWVPLRRGAVLWTALAFLA